MGVEFENEEAKAMEVANEIGPQIVGQITLVGGRLISMKTSEGQHTLVFDNGITAEISGSIKLRESAPADLGGGGKKELTGESVHEHFKQLETGDG